MKTEPPQKTRPPLRFIGTHVDEATYEAFSQAARASHRSRSAQVRHLIDLSLQPPSRPAALVSQPDTSSNPQSDQIPTNETTIPKDPQP
ncbi:ribbon-helix-helix domain-containing protein [Terrimicrobium sacchariphilum]|uniref:ribbon-helix-helix domain-containing protein n=1 Tax=Terrimicrobium sacchariphilum TaxID=690879 RepID=UPI00094639E2|nr:ribbon-helix-helix domain-containing protein [Terrimicrobium sacchariphilum]